MNETELLIDCVRRLNSAGLTYMLTGSMASNAWGIPRTTHDLDFVIQLPPSQITGMVGAFAGEYYIDEQAIRSSYQPPFQFNVIHVPSALKIDFWLLRRERFELEMFGRRVREEWFGHPLWLATPEDVILHKLYWNSISPSDRQLSDAAGVFAVQKPKLDLEYLHQWAAHLQISETLEKLLHGIPAPKTT